MLSSSRQTGVTLVELLIGMLVGLVVVAGGISVFTTSLRGQSDNIKLSRLNQDLRSMIDIMARDIRRAGFVTDDPVTYLASLKNNPFFDNTTTGATTELAVYDYASGNDNCIVYAYNANNDKPPAVQDNERFGFRLDTNTGVLEMRRSGSTNEDCDDGDWATITEPEVEITGLTFNLTSTTLNATSMATDTDGDGCYDGDDANPTTASSSCASGTYGNKLCDSGEACNTCTRDGSPDPACLYVRNVTISLSGRLRDDPVMTQTLIEQVRIRNDKFLDAIP